MHVLVAQILQQITSREFLRHDLREHFFERTLRVQEALALLGEQVIDQADHLICERRCEELHHQMQPGSALSRLEPLNSAQLDSESQENSHTVTEVARL